MDIEQMVSGWISKHCELALAAWDKQNVPHVLDGIKPEKLARRFVREPMSGGMLLLSKK